MTTFTIEITDPAHLDALAALTQAENDRAPASPLMSANDYIQKVTLSACASWAKAKRRQDFEAALMAAEAGDAAPLEALADTVATAATAAKTNATPKGIVTP